MTTTYQFPAVADAVARLPRVVDLLAARAQEHDRDAGFPYQGIEAVHEAGLLTLTVAERHGGAGGGLADTVRVLVELGRGDPSVALLCAQTLLAHAQQTGAHPSSRWPEGVYRELLADSVRGPALVGRLPGAATASARLEGGRWILTGRKTGVPGAEALAWMAVTARTEEEPPREGVFLVPGDSPGIQVEPSGDQLGLRASASHDVLLLDVAVDPEAVLGLRADRQPGPAHVPEAWANIAVPAVYLGVARAARDWLVTALRRGDADAATVAAVGLVEVELTGAEELLLSAAGRVDDSARDTAHDTDRDGTDRDGGSGEALRRSAAVRMLATRAAVGAVQQIVAISGSAGLSRANPLERHLRDVLHAHTLDPSDAELLRAAGRKALGGS
jgi:alkylation response protein AidB-like acyl-CoA dehydrogenase